MRTALALGCVLAVVGFAFADEPTGTVVGTVRYLDQVPPGRQVLTSDGVPIQVRDLVEDPATKGLRDVAVLLDVGRKVPPQARPAVIDQKDMRFVPRVLVVQEGQTVRFENSDLCNHGVKSASARPENAFDVTTPPGQAFAFKFRAEKGPVSITCQLHAWMQAWVYVVPHPTFAVTDARGNFHLADVPAGKHTLTLAHPDTNRQERVSVEVRPGETTRVQVEWRKK